LNFRPSSGELQGRGALLCGPASRPDELDEFCQAFRELRRQSLRTGGSAREAEPGCEAMEPACGGDGGVNRVEGAGVAACSIRAAAACRCCG
jgi:hypothetical protein